MSLRILVIDIDGVSLDFCLRCLEWGHEVKLFIRKDPKDGRSQVGDGMVEKVPHWEPHLNWSDLIVITGNDYYLHGLEHIRKHYPVFGPPLDGMRLELDREYGMKVLESCGIEVPEFHVFSSYEKAEQFVRKDPRRWVSKPTNDRDSNAVKSMSYVSKNPADMVYMLQRWHRIGKRHGEFILQQYVGGIEVGVSAWFGGGKWGKVNENFEFKKLMVGDLGMNTGEMGSALKYVSKSKLFDKLLKPLGGYLASIDYRGDIDINCKVDDQGHMWPLEFCSRLGWPAFYIMQAEHTGDPAQWMLDLMDGRDTLQVTYDIALGVVVAQPDFPYSKLTGKAVTGIPVYGIDEDNWANIHPSGMMAGKAPCMDGDEVCDQDCLVTCDDYILVASGLGKTVRQAKRAAYKVVDSISIPNSIMYRNDIGDRLEDDLPALQEHGFCQEWSY